MSTFPNWSIYLRQSRVLSWESMGGEGKWRGTDKKNLYKNVKGQETFKPILKNKARGKKHTICYKLQ